MSAEPWLQPNPGKRSARLRFGGTLLALFLCAAAVRGASAPAAPPRQPVRIQSEQLVAEMQADTAEFSGAVRVDGDGYTVTADVLTIQFRPGTVSRHQSAGTIPAGEISRMTARGQVRIRAEALSASAAQAVYEPDSGRLWLLTAEDSPAVQIRPEGGRAGPAGPRKEGQTARPASVSRVQVMLLPAAGP